MFKDEVEEAVKLFESSKARLEKGMKEATKMGSSDANDETMNKQKSRGKMRRITLNIVKKQTELMNTDIDKGNLIAAEGRRLLVEKLVAGIKPKA